MVHYQHMGTQAVEDASALWGQQQHTTPSIYPHHTKLHPLYGLRHHHNIHTIDNSTPRPCGLLHPRKGALTAHQTDTIPDDRAMRDTLTWRKCATPAPRKLHPLLPYLGASQIHCNQRTHQMGQCHPQCTSYIAHEPASMAAWAEGLCTYDPPSSIILHTVPALR